MYYFVQVIVPVAVEPTFTYLVSQSEFEFLQVGMRVAVPFGKTKVYTAIVTEKHHRIPEVYQAKQIYEIIDLKPIVTQNQIDLWMWISAYYMCTIGEVYKGAMPSNLLLESETLVQYNADNQIDPNELDDSQYLIYEALQSQPILKIQEIISILGKKKVFPIINSLLEKGIVTIQEELIDKYKPKQVKFIDLDEKYKHEYALSEILDVVKNAPKQKNLMLCFLKLYGSGKNPVQAKKLLQEAQVSSAVLKGLLDKEILQELFVDQDRVIFDHAVNHKVVLSENQDIALEQIKKSFLKKSVTLLHGVTASGKTEVYIKLIEERLSEQGQILFLVPDIGLTTQLVIRLTQYFGNQVAVYNSKYSANERLETWNQVLNGSKKAKIIIATRLGIFLPFDNLQLIIVDEEQEVSYKQMDPAPRYQARDCAIVLATQFKAKVLLGSATPSLESYYNATQDKYGLVNLDKRYNNIVLPEIVLVDLKDHYKRKQMTGHFSNLLLHEISLALSLGEQVIIYQNRRGFSPVVECMTCGNVPECPYCDVSLTYHKHKSELRCHYCGYSLAMPKQCVRCHSVDLNTKGFGTEQVQLELMEIFPDKTISRMDQDTTRGKYSYQKIVEDFQNKHIDILVGTQMLAKGFDFSNVNLVGILNADNSLYHPDFRAFERAYQMMVQISGRAGRGQKKGKVVIQTYNPNHNIIQQVTNYDYQGMFKEQMYDRYNFKYPPFYRLVKITLKHKEFEKLKQASIWLYNCLKQELGIPVLGPEEPSINRIRNQYLRIILIKIPQERSLINTKLTIAKVLKSFEAIGSYRSIRLVVNVDFY
ncbi:replication restart helicase PriA [Myroides sp. LJL119]